MAVYFVTGKLGSGKSLACVDKIRDYLSAGRKVATNLDLYLDGMFTYHDKSATRLPDKPRASDMEALGYGYDHEDDRHNDESQYGLIVLDECGTWLNSREWNDKDRRKLIDWFLHARKNRWDVMFLIQSIDACDTQLVSSLCEHLVVCRRMDKFKVARIPLPRFHIANVYYGRTTEVRVDRWTYRGTDLFDAYDTRQKFRDDVLYTEGGPVDMRAPYTMLSAHHLKGRYLPPPEPDVPLRRRFLSFWFRQILKVTLGPVIAVWMLIDADHCRRVAFRRSYLRERTDSLLARRSDRSKLIEAALDPRVYPPLELCWDQSSYQNSAPGDLSGAEKDIKQVAPFLALIS